MPPSDNASRVDVSRAYIAWVMVCLIWGTTYLGIRIALQTIPPMLMGALRWIPAGLIILAILRLRGERLPARSGWPSLFVLGILFIGFGNGAVVWAEQTVPSGLTAVLVAAVPFWMVGVERFMSEPDPLTLRRSAGLTIGFAGIVLLVWPELEMGAGRSFALGVGATQLACLGWAIGSSYSRRRQAAENVLAAAGLQMVFGGVCMLIVALATGELNRLTFTPVTAGALAYLTVFGSIGGFSAYVFALKHLPVATVSLYAYVNPVIAVLLGTAFLQEPLNPRLAAAAAVVLVGMALVRK